MFQTEQMKDLVLSACAAAEGGRISSFLGDLVPLKMDVASFFPSLEGFQTWSERHHHLNCWWLPGVWIIFGCFTANYVGQFQKRRALSEDLFGKPYPCRSIISKQFVFFFRPWNLAKPFDGHIWDLVPILAALRWVSFECTIGPSGWFLCLKNHRNGNGIMIQWSRRMMFRMLNASCFSRTNRLFDFWGICYPVIWAFLDEVQTLHKQLDISPRSAQAFALPRLAFARQSGGKCLGKAWETVGRRARLRALKGVSSY